MMSTSSTLKKTVAFQGVAGSFSSMAARTLFGSNLTALHTLHFREIFQHVVTGNATVGVVPIENALAGSVHENFDLLQEYPCSIIAEVYLPVQLHVVGHKSDKKISKIYSHPKALEQCSLFLERNSDIEAVIWSDTAGAAHHVALLGDHSIAAIASEEAAALHGLSIRERAIQNHSENATRFVAISTQPLEEPNPTKCSLIVSIAHKPGSLHTILGEIAMLNLNLTKLESRPILGAPFSYSFHLDFECSKGDSTILRHAVSRILELSEKVKLLGFYRSSR